MHRKLSAPRYNVSASELHSAIGRHDGATGPGTTSPALIRSNPVYRIVIEDREDIAVSVGEIGHPPSIDAYEHGRWYA